MSEERLIEITSEIIKYDGPLGRMAYISTLNEDEIAVLKDCISNPTYAELNIYEKLLKFSQDYLESKNISFMNVFSGENLESNHNDVALSYLEKMLSVDEGISLSTGNKARK